MKQLFTEERKTMGQAYQRKNIPSSALYKTGNFKMFLRSAGRGVWQVV